MSDSILDTVKQMLGIDPSYTAFDTDVIVDINSVMLNLAQIGVPGAEGFQIEDSTATWDDLLDGDCDLNAVKTYVYLKTRLLFDPPSSNLVSTIQEQASELEWRILIDIEDDASESETESVDESEIQEIVDAAVAEALEGYATDEDVEEALEAYTADVLTAALESYATDEEVSATVQEALSSYITSDEASEMMTELLESYATNEEVAEAIAEAVSSLMSGEDGDDG